MLLESGFHGRGEFGCVISEMGLDGEGVEVGTHRGEFADLLLSRSDLRTLYCVDPYESGYDPDDPSALGDRDADRVAAKELLSRHGERYAPVYAPSPRASATFADDSLDFVYVDGNHQLESVTADLGAWWPKLRRGGLLAGHDIVCRNEAGGGWGQFIQPAVFSFAQEVGRNVHLVSESDGLPWSFYIVK